MIYLRKIIFSFIILLPLQINAQQKTVWPDGKKAAIVLTYDDALVSQLDIAIPQLDEVNLKGTFFLNEPAVEAHVGRWKAVADKGHELGNHTIFHPCMGHKIPKNPHYHSENYSSETILKEIRAMNKFLFALDNKHTHNYAYPCYETEVGGKSYVDSLRNFGFVKYARAGETTPIITDFKNLDPYLVSCQSFDNPNAEDLIGYVKNVLKQNGLGIFIFHGVGGDYLQVSSVAHKQLVQYLKANSKELWITTFDEAMNHVSKFKK